MEGFIKNLSAALFNMLYQIYNKLDEGIMKGVNAGVRTWNWTTGRTKGDLANGMLSMAVILESTGWINNGNYLFTVLALFTSHKFQNDNLEMEVKEENASNNGLKDYNFEDFKMKNKVMGLLALPACPYFATNHSHDGKLLPDTSFTDHSLALGFGMRSASHYVICADYLPPRKNCFSRGFGKLKSWYNSLASLPVKVPQPAQAYNSINLEERLT